ncbi:hypothetical protein [Streptomyces scopuliridis]|uniref:hypothetical protein n=1 Tax=Streptomyces scopuliridis TaxID=452529 RepID=UPI0036BF2576
MAVDYVAFDVEVPAKSGTTYYYRLYCDFFTYLATPDEERTRALAVAGERIGKAIEAREATQTTIR